VDELRFDTQVAVVTGAAFGMGREHATLLAERGAKVVVNDIGSSDSAFGTGGSVEPVDAVVSEITAAGGEAIGVHASVSTPEGARSVIDAALDTWGRLDVVINNAGVTGPFDALFEDLTDEQIESVLGVHLWGPVNILRAALPIMKAQRYGRILNVSSSTIFGSGEPSPYILGKGAVLALTKNLATAGFDFNVKANAIMPIAFTRMIADNIPEPRRTWFANNFPSSAIAPAVAFLVHDAVPCSGECFSVGGGRLARVAFIETDGAASLRSPEDVRDNFDEVMNSRQHLVTKSVDDVNLYIDVVKPVSTGA